MSAETEVMSLIPLVGLALGGYVVYQVLTMNFGSSITNLTDNRIINPGHFFSDDKLSGSSDHWDLALGTKSTPPRTVRVSQVNNHLYHVDIGDGAVFEVDSNGFQEIMKHKHNFNLVWQP